MTRSESEPDDIAVATVLRTALAGQYHAALAMLRQAIQLCPDTLWSERGPRAPFWRVAYHTLYYADLYLQPGERSFRPWARHQTGIQDLDDVPAPPHLQDLLELPDRPPQTGVPYTKGEVLEYLDMCDGMVEAALDRLDVLAPETGFSWHDPQRSAVEQHIDNVRHIQHHTTQLADRVRASTGACVDWVGSLHPTRPGDEHA